MNTFVTEQTITLQVINERINPNNKRIGAANNEYILELNHTN